MAAESMKQMLLYEKLQVSVMQLYKLRYWMVGVLGDWVQDGWVGGWVCVVPFTSKLPWSQCKGHWVEFGCREFET